MGIPSIDAFWRISRSVSTESRLKLLWLLFETGELSVKKLALGSGITESYASFQLKVLFSAGLLRFRRKNMCVIYRAEALMKDSLTAELLVALGHCCEKKVPFESITRQVTAYTHERRIEIVRLLVDGSLSFNKLMERSGMTSSALSRHLLKLEARKIVRWDGELYRIVQPKNQLGKTLLEIVCRKDV